MSIANGCFLTMDKRLVKPDNQNFSCSESSVRTIEFPRNYLRTNRDAIAG